MDPDKWIIDYMDLTLEFHKAYLRLQRRRSFIRIMFIIYPLYTSTKTIEIFGNILARIPIKQT